MKPELYTILAERHAADQDNKSGWPMWVRHLCDRCGHTTLMVGQQVRLKITAQGFQDLVEKGYHPGWYYICPCGHRRYLTRDEAESHRATAPADEPQQGFPPFIAES